MLFLVFFFFTDTATTDIYTLSLHDALPISRAVPRGAHRDRPRHPAVAHDRRRRHRLRPRDLRRAAPAAAGAVDSGPGGRGPRADPGRQGRPVLTARPAGGARRRARYGPPIR